MCIDEICDPRATRMLVDTDGILNNHGREIPSLFGGGAISFDFRSSALFKSYPPSFARTDPPPRKLS